MPNKTIYIAKPSQPTEFMHNIPTLQEYSLERIFEKIATATHDYRYTGHNPTGRPLPITMIYPEVQWEISERGNNA